MKRIVWVAVTILIMILILGIGLHTLNNISDVNRKRREKDAGEEFAAKVIMTTATTSIWDKVRTTTEPLPTDENGNPIETSEEASEPDNSGAMAAPEGDEPEQEPTDAPVVEEGELIPETAPDIATEQTTVQPIVITVD